MNTIDILIVEDDPAIHQLLLDILALQPSYQAHSAYSGTEAMMLLKDSSRHFDLMLLDLMLPGLSGEEVLSQLDQQCQTGIIVLSAKSELEDKVSLLKLGADDYLTKPFHHEELLARMESVLRRYDISVEQVPKAVLNYRELTCYPDSYEVSFGESPLRLTRTEFDILYLLVSHPDQVFTRDRIYQEIWPEGDFVEDNAINVHISNLRKKIAHLAGDQAYIETIWGIGFKMA